MSTLEAYIFRKYGRWIKYEIASNELGFSIMHAVDATVTRSCQAGMEPKIYWHVKDQQWRMSGGLIGPKLKPIKYSSTFFAIDPLSVDSMGERLLYTELARLLNLNLHLDLGFEETVDKTMVAIDDRKIISPKDIGKKTGTVLTEKQRLKYT